MKYRPKKTDPSSKYGLNPGQFEKDVEENRRKYIARKQKFKDTLLGLMHDTTYHEDNFHLILQCLREIKETNQKM